MNRLTFQRRTWLSRLLLALALVCGQAAAQLHALEHAIHESGHGECVHSDDGHAANLAESGACLLVHALDSVLPALVLPAPGGAVLAAAPDLVSIPFLPVHAGPFEPRAPPAFS